MLNIIVEGNIFVCEPFSPLLLEYQYIAPPLDHVVHGERVWPYILL